MRSPPPHTPTCIYSPGCQCQTPLADNKYYARQGREKLIRGGWGTVIHGGNWQLQGRTDKEQLAPCGSSPCRVCIHRDLPWVLAQHPGDPGLHI